MNNKSNADCVYRSINVLIQLHYATKSLSKTDLNDMFYFIKAIGIMADPTTGVQHAGGLLSQHLLVIGASLGVYPSMFTTYGEIIDKKS
jgi:hypothetical protein